MTAAPVLLALSAAGPAWTQASQPRPAGPATLVFKTNKLPSQEPIRALLDRFERMNPGVKVRHEILPSSTDEQHQFYATNLYSRGADFDVFALDIIWVPEFARAGWLMDLSSLMDRSYLDEYLPGAVESVTWGGRIWAVPWFLDAGVLYYRKDLLDKYGLKPPDTFPELMDAAQKVMRGEKNPRLRGYLWQGRQYEGLVCTALEHIWGNGGEVIGQDGRCALDSPQAVEALGFMRDLISLHRVSPEYVTTAEEEDCRHVFGNGDAVFMRNWPYCWAIFNQEGSRIRGKFGIKVMPHFPGHASAATLGGWQLGMNANTRYPAEAWKLLKFMAGHDAKKALVMEFGFKPTRRSLYRDRDIAGKHPLIAELAETMKYARPRPVSPNYPRISQVMQEEFSAAVTGTKAPADAMRDAKAKIDAVLVETAGK